MIDGWRWEGEEEVRVVDFAGGAGDMAHCHGLVGGFLGRSHCGFLVTDHAVAGRGRESVEKEMIEWV